MESSLLKSLPLRIELLSVVLLHTPDFIMLKHIASSEALAVISQGPVCSITPASIEW